MEVAVQTRLNYLQRFKDTAAYRIKHLQKQVEESVHQTELDKINRKYEDVVEKYRDLLEQQHSHVQQTEQASLLTVGIACSFDAQDDRLTPRITIGD